MQANTNKLLYLFIGFLFVFPVSIFTYFKIFYFYIVFCIFIVLIISFEINAVPSRLIKATAFLSLLFISFFITSFWGINVRNSNTQLFYFLIYFLEFIIFCYAIIIYSPQQISKVISLFPLFLFLINIYLIIQYGSIRADTVTKDVLKSYSNHMTSLCEFCLPILIYSLRYLKIKKPFVLKFLILITIINILLSQSRGGYFILLITLVITPFILGKKKPLDLIKVYLMYLFLFATIIFILYNIPLTKIAIEKSIERITSTSSEISQAKLSRERLSREGSTRVIMYLYGQKIIKKYFWTGLGFGNFKTEMEKNFRVGVVPHNIFLEVISSGGVISLIVLLIIVLKTQINLFQLYKFYKDKDENLAYWYLSVFFTFLLILIHGQFRPTLDNITFYLPIAIAFMDIYKINER